MATTKKTNYSAQEIAILSEKYTGSNNALEVKAIAQELNRTETSVRSKLVQMKLYVKATPVAKKAATGNKLDVAQKITKLVGLDDFQADGLAKANRSALDQILVKLTRNEQEVISLLTDRLEG